MPAALVATTADATGIDIAEAEKRWKQAKTIAGENGLKESDGDDFWKYVTGVFKKSMGIGAVMESATAEDVHAAAHEAATSHLNDLPQPTQAQKEAGKYKMGHLRLHGLGITIENPKGSTRKGVSPDGKPWESKMAAHYGYIKGTVGRDKDHLDVYIGDHPESKYVYVVDQVDPGTRKFDEHKIMMGFRNSAEARKNYLANYEKGWQGLEAITGMTMGLFKAWLSAGNTKKPIQDTVLESAATAFTEDFYLRAALRAARDVESDNFIIDGNRTNRSWSTRSDLIPWLDDPNFANFTPKQAAAALDKYLKNPQDPTLGAVQKLLVSAALHYEQDQADALGEAEGHDYETEDPEGADTSFDFGFNVAEEIAAGPLPVLEAWRNDILAAKSFGDIQAAFSRKWPGFIDPPSTAEIIETFRNEEDGTEARVAKVDRGYSVTLKDLDSGEVVSVANIYPDVETAIIKAKEAAGVINRLTNNSDGGKVPASTDKEGAMKEHVEVSRQNVTVAEFFRIVKAACEKKGLSFDLDRDTFEKPPVTYDDTYTVRDGVKYARYGKGEPTREYDGSDAGAKAETYRVKPYDYQCYILNHDGSVWNESCEFTFDDEKRGYGYYYQASTGATDPEKVQS